MNPKYILLHDGSMKLGRVAYHMELHTPIKEIKSGGWWELSEDNKTLNLYGISSDFGPAKVSDIIECFVSGKQERGGWMNEVTSVQHSNRITSDMNGWPYTTILVRDTKTNKFVKAN